MQGEDVTVENIKTEVNNVKNYMESEKFKQSATSVGKRFGEIVIWFSKIFFGILGAILGIVGFVLIGALILVLFFLIFDPAVINSFAPDLISNWTVITPEKLIMLIVSLFLVIGCPIFLLIYWAVRIISGRHNSPRTASWVVLILWVAGLFMFYSVGANTIIHFHNNNGHPFSINWSDENKPFEDVERKCEPFHSIDIAGNFELNLRKDSMQKVTISSPNDFMSKVVTKVENGVLHVYSEGFLLNRTIKVIISSDSLSSLVAKGACKIEADSQIAAHDFSLELLGASDAKMDMKITNTFNVEVEGASKLELTGSCVNLKLEGKGASEVDATNLTTKNAVVYVAGASHAKVYASESVKLEAYGASEIDCKGSPKHIEKNDSGASNINIE